MEEQIHELVDKDSFKKKLDEYKIFFSKIKNSESTCEKIEKSLKLLDSKISLGVVGPAKAGKSKVLNALIGKEILASKALPCTFFATKIRPTFNTYAFYEESKPSERIETLTEIKKKIEELNTTKRAERAEGKLDSSGNVWILEVPFIAFKRDHIYSSIKHAFPYIEIVDLPGITDDHYEFINKERVGDQQKIDEADNFKTKFNELVELIDFSSLILIFDLTQSHEISKFLKYFQANLLTGKNRFLISSTYDNKNLMMIINKLDILKLEEQKITKEKVSDLIFRKFHGFFHPKNWFSQIWKEFKEWTKYMDFFVDFLFKNNQKDELEKMTIEVYKKKYEKFLEQTRMTFVSANSALESVYVDEDIIEKQRKILGKMKKTKQQIEEDLKNYIETLENESNYDQESFYDQFIQHLSQIYLNLYKDKIEKNINASLEEFEESKQSVLGRYKNLNENNVIRIKKEEFEKIKNLFYADFDTIFNNHKQIFFALVNAIVEIKEKYLDKHTNSSNSKDLCIFSNFVNHRDSSEEWIRSLNKFIEQIEENTNIFRNKIINSANTILTFYNDHPINLLKVSELLSPRLKKEVRSYNEDLKNYFDRIKYQVCPDNIVLEKNSLVYFFFRIFKNENRKKSIIDSLMKHHKEFPMKVKKLEEELNEKNKDFEGRLRREFKECFSIYEEINNMIN